MSDSFSIVSLTINAELPRDTEALRCVLSRSHFARKRTETEIDRVTLRMQRGGRGRIKAGSPILLVAAI